MKIIRLIERAKSLKTMQLRKYISDLRPLGAQESYSKGLTGLVKENPLKIKSGPPDLALFRCNFIEGKIYHWRIYYTDSLLCESDNVNKRLVGSVEEGGLEYFTDEYLFASSSLRGTDYLGIDLHPERFGWIGNFWYEGNLAEGNFPVVAHSFTEWLERTLDAGPDATCHYWEMPDFKDMGPAIPNDPNYVPRNRISI